MKQPEQRDMKQKSFETVERFQQLLEEGLRRCELLHQARVAVGVSGGADSTALLLGTVALKEKWKVQLVVVHVNHGLRGEEADEDERWVAQLAEKLNLQVCRKRVQIGGAEEHTKSKELQLQRGEATEEAARKARFQALEQAALENECSFLLLAHTADDQAETVLHHVVRGTGLAGLKGMPERRRLDSGVVVCRPMLRIWRRDVLAFLQLLHQDFRHDRTNSELVFTRNRIRHRLLPLLEREFNPNVKEALVKLSWQAAEVQQTFDRLSEPVVEQALVDVSERLVRVDTRPLVELPRHLLRECLRKIWRKQRWPEQAMSFAHWDALAETCLSGRPVTLPGRIQAVRRNYLLVLERRSEE